MSGKRARVVKIRDEWDGQHTLLHITTRDDCAVAIIRGGPKRAYIWIGREDGTFITTIEGEKVLRKFASAILKELRPRKQRSAS